MAKDGHGRGNRGRGSEGHEGQSYRSSPRPGDSVRQEKAQPECERRSRADDKPEQRGSQNEIHT